MKKLFLSLVAAIVAATATYAQSLQLATLSHEGQLSTYYGAGALGSAYAAADHGDIITLSSGTFNAVNIEKGLTIRGAGMAIDTVSKALPTYIVGDFNISIPDSITNRLTLEGIFHGQTISIGRTLRNATFIKDRLGKITYKGNSNSAKAENLSLIQCKVKDGFSLASSSISLVNSYVFFLRSDDNLTTVFDFLNCIIRSDGGLSTYDNAFYCIKSTFNNCIICSSYLDRLHGTCAANYCIGLGNNDIFHNIPNTTNKIKNYADVFKTYAGTYNDNETFELTDEAKTTLLGIDDTQVGIYGGNMPFSITPTNPQITKCKVAAKSTADGKLSVEVAVDGVE